MFFFVYPALNPFKYPPPDLMGLEKGLSEKLQNKKFSTPTETHPCKKKVVS